MSGSQKICFTYQVMYCMCEKCCLWKPQCLRQVDHLVTEKFCVDKIHIWFQVCEDNVVWALHFDIVLSFRFTCPGDVHLVFHTIGIFKMSEGWQLPLAKQSNKAVIAFCKCYRSLTRLSHTECLVLSFLKVATLVHTSLVKWQPSNFDVCMCGIFSL